MDYFKTLWDALEPLAETAWSDCTVFYRSSQGRALNFRQVIEDLALTAPFAVFQVGPASSPDGWGPNSVVHSVPVGIYYVREGWLSATADVTAYRIVERQCEAKAKAMQDALLAYSGTAFQVVLPPAIDCSEQNPANALFATNGTDLWSGQVQAELLVGETA